MNLEELRKLPHYIGSDDPADRDRMGYDGHYSEVTANFSRNDIRQAAIDLVRELDYQTVFKAVEEITSIEEAEARRAALTDKLDLLHKRRNSIMNKALASGISGNLFGNIFKGPTAEMRMAIEKELGVLNKHIDPIKGSGNERRRKRRHFFARKAGH